MLEQIRQSIEQAQMVLVGIGTEFAVKEEAQEDPFFTELLRIIESEIHEQIPLRQRCSHFIKAKRKWAAVKKNRFRRHMKFWQIF